MLSIKTFWIQIVKGSFYSEQALEQQTRDRLITSNRGTIYDTNGKALAVSASVEAVSASPKVLKDLIEDNKDLSIEQIAKGLSDILELDYDSTVAKLNQSASYVILKRKVEKEPADRVRQYISDNEIEGIYLDEDSKRYYPFGDFASQVIGFVGTDNQGLEGIEAVMDDELNGTSGRVISAKSASGSDMPFDYEKMIDPQDGLDVVLTIDEGVQQFVEKHLETAIVENKLAQGAAAVVMNVKTGEILAMATKPSFDLNAPMTITDDSVLQAVEALPEEEKVQAKSTYLSKLWRNKAVVDTYEPGSVFKIFVAAMGLESNVVHLADQFYCKGVVNVAGTNIKCWKAGGHAAETFVDGIKNSCNPVFMEVGARLGPKTFYDYYRGFGFMNKTGIELSGEAVGPFHALKNLNAVELATCSFGQSFQVTPLQMVTGIAAIANDGKLMKPHIVKELKDSQGNIVETIEPTVVRQIISKETSDTVCDLLEKVVSEGTGSNAYVSGYRVAGKTGTSEKFETVNGKTVRANGKYIASFGAFAPADDPEIACIVILDEPTGGSYFGGVIAGPVMGRLMADVLPYLNIEPQYTPEELAQLENPVPDVVGMKLDNAKNTLIGKQFTCKVIGDGGEVLSQIPTAGTRVNANSVITLYTSNNGGASMVEVPSVTNLSVAEATRIITNAGLNIKVTGAGATAKTASSTAFTQSPAAGAKLEAGSIVTVEFRTLDTNSE
ncbi:MAG: PASTA domain-containing protein [Clostridiales bacterium]|nr:PASTA domain-containing protein [Clostridiales bacterium]